MTGVSLIEIDAPPDGHKVSSLQQLVSVPSVTAILPRDTKLMSSFDLLTKVSCVPIGCQELHCHASRSAIVPLANGPLSAIALYVNLHKYFQIVPVGHIVVKDVVDGGFYVCKIDERASELCCTRFHGELNIWTRTIEYDGADKEKLERYEWIATQEHDH